MITKVATAAKVHRISFFNQPDPLTGLVSGTLSCFSRFTLFLFLESWTVWWAGVEEEGGSWNAITELATDICCSMDFQLFLPATIVSRKISANDFSSKICRHKYEDPDFEYFL